MKHRRIVLLVVLVCGIIMQSCKKSDDSNLPNIFKINYLECIQSDFFVNQVEAYVYAEISIVNNTEFEATIETDYVEFQDLENNPYRCGWGGGNIKSSNGATIVVKAKICNGLYYDLTEEKTIKIKAKLTAVFITSKSSTEKISDEEEITVTLKPRVD